MKFPCKMKIINTSGNNYLQRHIAEHGYWIDVIWECDDPDLLEVQSPGRRTEKVFANRLVPAPMIVFPSELFEL